MYMYANIILNTSNMMAAGIHYICGNALFNTNRIYLTQSHSIGDLAIRRRSQ